METLALTTVDLARIQFATTSLYQGWTYYVLRARVMGAPPSAPEPSGAAEARAR